MRTLNDYFIDGGTLVMSTPNAVSPRVCVPEAGQLIGVMVHLDASPSAADAADILKNDADTASDAATAADIDVLASHAADDGAEYAPDLDVHVEAGDSLQLRAEGAMAATVNGWITWIIRR
jgi:hypothetical protein